MATIFRRFGMKCLGFRLTWKPSQAQIFDLPRIYDRIDARRDLSLGEVHLDTAFDMLLCVVFAASTHA
jgi:hypothetical protein